MNNVRTTLVLVALSLLFSSAPLVAQEGTVGENFEAAGTAVGVSGSYYNDLDGYWSFYVRPSFDFYLMDGLALSASARYYTRSDYPDEISLSTGLSYTIRVWCQNC